MDEETKKRFPKEFSLLETKNSLLKGPIGLNDYSNHVKLGLPDLYKTMEKDLHSLPKVEDIQNRIDILKTQENVDPEFIEHLEEMKKFVKVQSSRDLDPMEEIQGYNGVQDMIRDEQNAIINKFQEILSKESKKMITEQIESNPGIFRSKYPELYDYMMTLEY